MPMVKNYFNEDRRKFLNGLKSEILGVQDIDATITPFAGTFTIPTCSGKPVGTNDDIGKAFQDLINEKQLHGVVNNDVFVSDVATMEIFRTLDREHHGLNEDELGKKIWQIDRAALLRLLCRLTAEQHIVIKQEEAKGIIFLLNDE